MQNHVLFERKIMQNFDFQGRYVGYVVDNSNFEDELRIKVFVPELFGYNYSVNISKEGKEMSITTEHILNHTDLNISTTIKKNEFMYARCLIKRDTLISEEEFLKGNKPEIGDKVLVSFFNGNPSNCVYENIIFLSDKETIKVSSGSNSKNIIDIFKNSSDKRGNTQKIIWDL